MKPIPLAMVDLRVITFYEEAVGAAYIAHLQRNGSPKFRKVKKVLFEADLNRVTIIVDGGNVLEEFQVDLPTLGVSLLFFCIQAHIPIPRKARRTVAINQDAVILTLEVSYPTVPILHDRPVHPRSNMTATVPATVARRMAW